MSVDHDDLRILEELEKGLPLVPEPFEEIGLRLGMSGADVVGRILRLRSEGVVRKFRARINQRLAGITANALVAWKIPGAETARIGPELASFPAITHCYERAPVPGRWEYTLYTVHHGHSREGVLDEVRTISEKIGYKDYEVLFSTKEYKRVPNVRIGENGHWP
jgi:DNA-binding Lrp family transcriptional regulator